MNNLMKTRRKELNITLEEIGNYVGVSKTTVQRWESGNISNMRRDKIKKLCEILQLDTEQLLGMEMQQEADFVKIPILGKFDADVPLASQKDVVGYEYIPKERLENCNIFAVRIEGDSMEPRIAQGDIVIVKEQKTVENGETAVVIIGEDFVCKKVVKHSNTLVLISNNPKYEPMLFGAGEIKEKPVIVAGKVVELRARF